VKIQKQAVVKSDISLLKLFDKNSGSNTFALADKAIGLNSRAQVISTNTCYGPKPDGLVGIESNKFTNRRNMKELLRQARDWFNSFRPTPEQYFQIAEMEKRMQENKLKCRIEMQRFF